MTRTWSVALGAIVTIGIAFQSHANDTVRYATDGYGLGAIIIVAAEKGYFAENSIDPVIQTYAFGVDTVDAVLAGNADFGIAIDLPALTRFNSGKLVSPAIIATPKPGYDKLYARNGLHVASDFRGKTFGIATGTAQEFLTRAYISHLGLDPDKDVTLMGSADLFTIVGAMKAGRVDAAWIWGEGVAPIKADGKFSFLGDDSIVNRESSALLVTSKTFASNKSHLVEKSLKAVQKALAFMTSDEEAAAQIVAAKTGADVTAVRTQIESNRYGLSLASAPFENLRESYEFLVKAGRIRQYDLLSQFEARDLSIAVPGADIDPALK